MSGRQGFTSDSIITYVYQESPSVSSVALGIDGGDDHAWKLKALQTNGATPDGTCHVRIDSLADGDITFTPNGTGRVVAATGITATTGGLTVSAGDITLTPIAATVNGVVRASSTGVLTTLEDSTVDGQVLISAAAGVPAWTSLTAGTNITITPGANSISIAAAITDVTWSEETGATTALEVAHGYVMNNNTLITATLPATAAQFSTIIITGKGVGGWLIAQNAGQTIHYLGSDSTLGVGGSLASTNSYDCLELVCIAANTSFVVRNSVGNLTIV